ncbi:MAG: uracil phosphoribosyltransferase [Muribaculum sp.]|nr:uracil phosphoribosyltransferase [Muribaculum sp.]
MNVINFDTIPSVVSNYMSQLRDTTVQTDRMRFRRNLERIGEIMAYEISKTLDYTTVDTITPLATASCRHIADHVVLATIFRAGLPFHQGFLNILDGADNAFVSAYRQYTDEENFDVNIEYLASPRLNGSTLIIADPMLATGTSMEMAYRALLTKGNPAHVHLAAVIASQAAVDYVKSHFPADSTTLWVGAIDPELNAHSYIVPGLGDAGDLAYGGKD